MSDDGLPATVEGAVVFTDLVGFTEYTAVQGNAAAAHLLGTQEPIVTDALPADARIVKELGDGLMIWFPEPCTAVRVCLDLLDAFETASDRTLEPLWVRMGMHFGVQTTRRDDLIGHAVNLAARISDQAGAGELLVSEETVAATRESGEGLEFESIGPVLLKGIPDSVEIYRATRD